MSPDNQIIPVEASHPRGVIVTRHVFDGANRYGKPHSQRLSEDLFYSFLDAFRFASEDQTVNHRFSTYLRFPIHAKLSGIPRSDNERLIVEIGGNRGVSPRTIMGHHSVSADDAYIISLNIEKVGNPTTFDRGLAWITNLEYDSPHFSFTVLGHEAGWQSDLPHELEGMLKRTNQVLGDLVAGMSTRKKEKQNLLE